jgi:photosystem II stability/assembly factor-like uncharacterized protein
MGMASNSTSIFAATLTGMYRSEDFGNHWKPINSGLYLPRAWDIDVRENHAFIVQSGLGISYTANQGELWETCNNGLSSPNVNCITIDGNFAYTGTDGGGVLRNDINGTLWVPIQNGVPFSDVNAIEASGDTIFAGTMAGLFRSTDVGISWFPVNAGPPEPRIMDLLIHKNEIYALDMSEGIFRSEDGGNTWVAVNTGLTSLNTLRAIAYEDILFLTTQDSSIFYSLNKGDNWFRINEGLNGARPRSLAVQDNYLFTGTLGNGVFRRSIPEILSTNESFGTPAISIYPNPAVGSIQFAYQPISTIAAYSIVDIYGHVVQTGNLKPGQTQTIALHIFIPGLYMIVICDGNRMLNQKFVRLTP